MSALDLRLHRDEADFHDRWAVQTRVEDVDVRAAFEAPTALENRFVLRLLGDLKGLRILDVGTGLGESAVYFALCGARVTATDLSPEMVDFARRLARHHGVVIRTAVTPAEVLDTSGEVHDVVYAANVLHHVDDRRRFFEAVDAALAPGGRFVTWDPLVYNPVIGIYRRLATEVRTADETPLSFRDLRLARERFVDVGHREFWIAALALFLKYYAIDRVHPNDERYWKRIYRESPATLRWWRPLAALDRSLTRIPLVRRLAWNMVMWGRKAERSE